jgi:transposase
MITHRPYPSDASDAEWEFVRPYLCLLPEDAGQRVYSLRDVFDALRWMVRGGSPWRSGPSHNKSEHKPGGTPRVSEKPMVLDCVVAIF